MSFKFTGGSDFTRCHAEIKAENQWIPSPLVFGTYQRKKVEAEKMGKFKRIKS